MLIFRRENVEFILNRAALEPDAIFGAAAEIGTRALRAKNSKTRNSSVGAFVALSIAVGFPFDPSPTRKPNRSHGYFRDKRAR